MKRNTGFTLIELMIVIAIVGILVAVAVPLYQRYVIRSQLSEGLSLSGGAKSAVSEYYMENGTWPSDNDAAGLSIMTEIVGDYTARIEVKDNVIEIQYGGAANAAIFGELLALVAVDNLGSVAWTCSSPTGIEARHLPDACR